MGITEATVALHSTMATMVRVTTMPISGPTPRLQALTQAARAMAVEMSRPVESSFLSTVPRFFRLTSPTAMARTIVVVIWVPLLPPVPIRSGMKKASAMAASSCSSNARSTVPV